VPLYLYFDPVLGDAPPCAPGLAGTPGEPAPMPPCAPSELGDEPPEPGD
jgi:hypothetical protein